MRKRQRKKNLKKLHALMWTSPVVHWEWLVPKTAYYSEKGFWVMSPDLFLPRSPYKSWEVEKFEMNTEVRGVQGVPG